MEEQWSKMVEAKHMFDMVSEMNVAEVQQGGHERIRTMIGECRFFLFDIVSFR